MSNSSEKVVREVIQLSDPEYFCNVSWTLSYNFNTRSWISFHSYLPNFYIPEISYFYSGVNTCCEEFDFLVGTLVPTPSTTTTTTTHGVGPITTTTTTTTAIDCVFDALISEIDCALEGIGEIVSTDCELEGEGYALNPECDLEGTGTILPTTSTTTSTSTSTSTTTSTSTSTTTSTTTLEPTTTTTTTTSEPTTTTTTTTSEPTTTTTTTTSSEPTTTTTTTTSDLTTTTTTTTAAPTTTTTTTAEPTTTTTSTSTSTSTTTSTSTSTTTTTSTSTTSTTTTAAPCVDCYVYEYVNSSDPPITIDVNGTLCAGGSYSEPVAPGGEGVTLCIQELSQATIDAYLAMGLTLTQGFIPCGNSCPSTTTTTTTSSSPTTTTTTTTSGTTTTTTTNGTTTTTTTIQTIAIDVYSCGDCTQIFGIGIIEYSGSYVIGEYYGLDDGRVGQIMAITNTLPITHTVTSGPYPDCATAQAAVCV